MEIVRAGYAWLYDKYCTQSFCHNWKKSEIMVKWRKIGLWQDSNPVPPWEWRKGKRSAVSEKKALEQGKFNGNVKSKVFHAPGCRYYDCKNCIKGFDSIDDAMSAGYRPHKQCVR